MLYKKVIDCGCMRTMMAQIHDNIPMPQLPLLSDQWIDDDTPSKPPKPILHIECIQQKINKTPTSKKIPVRLVPS